MLELPNGLGFAQYAWGCYVRLGPGLALHHHHLVVREKRTQSAGCNDHGEIWA